MFEDDFEMGLPDDEFTMDDRDAEPGGDANGREGYQFTDWSL